MEDCGLVEQPGLDEPSHTHTQTAILLLLYIHIMYPPSDTHMHCVLSEVHTLLRVYHYNDASLITDFSKNSATLV